MPGPIIQDEHDAQWRLGRTRWMTQPRFPLSNMRSLSFGRQAFDWLLFLQFGEQFAELLFEPGMEHRVRDGDDAFGS